MKTMTNYTIPCTPEQTKKALELGAPIRRVIDDEELDRLTSEEVNIMNIESSTIGIPNDHFASWVIDFAEEAFKAGYHIAKSE